MKEKTSQTMVNRQYKSRIFEMLYEDKKELLDLYNAINGTQYSDPAVLEINTLKNAIYMSMHNDVSFVIGSVVSLYEHQSTFSPNLSLRFLFYIADGYSAMTRNMNLYGRGLINLPVPKFIIFYNGVEERPEREELTLSSLYERNTRARVEADLELKATLLNINSGYNEKLKNICKYLGDYCEYTRRVREYVKEMPIELAVDKAIDECIKEDILSDFLLRNKMEARKMSIYEYDEEKHMRMEREASFAEGQRALLLQKIEKKLAKGKTVAQIAEDLEESEEKIRELMEK